jgi:hypothetical protein
MKSHRLAAVLLLLFTGGLAHADDGIVTERPSFVDSGETVPVGMLQIEAGAQNAHDGSSNEMTLPTLVRWGVGESWELRFESDLYDRSNTDSPHYVDGWANLTVGVKHHVGGADDSGPKSAWFVEVELPTGASPYRGQGARPSTRWVSEWDLPNDFSLGVMPGIKYDDGERGRFLSGSFGVDLAKNFSDAAQGFIELAAPQIASARDGGSQLSFDAGVQYRLGKNLQLDAAANFGMNDRTPDVTYTIGISRRW